MLKITTWLQNYGPVLALKDLQVHGKNVKFSKSFDETDLRDRLQILSLAIKDIKRIHELYYPWNQQKTVFFLMISWEMEAK